MTAKTSEKLAVALEAAGLKALAIRARTDEFHDYLSDHVFPELELVGLLLRAGTPAAMGLRRRVIDGEFDASREESDEWAASPEGQAAFAELVKGEKTDG
jgi:hypothetical protein